MFKNAIRLRPWGAALALALLACGGNGHPGAPVAGTGTLPPVDPATAGSLTVTLVKDGLGEDLAQLNLAFRKLEVRSGGLWRPVLDLPAPAPAVNVLAATSQAPAVLASSPGVAWPPGPCDALRITLGPSTASLANDPDTPLALAVPEPFVCPMGLPGILTVATGQNTELRIEFNVDHVVQALVADPQEPATYRLVPGAVRGYDLAATGSITGQVGAAGTAGAPGPPLGGTAVTAQLQMPAAPVTHAIAFRTVRTDASGNFSLDLLPRGAAYTWTVVSQLVIGPPAYGAALGSPAQSLGDGAQLDTFSALVAPPAAQTTSTLTGTVAVPPAPGQAVWVDLVEVVPADPSQSLQCPFVVASAPVAADGSFAFPAADAQVPTGVYAAVLHTYTPGPGQELVDTPRSSAPIVLQTGVPQTISF